MLVVVRQEKFGADASKDVSHCFLDKSLKKNTFYFKKMFSSLKILHWIIDYEDKTLSNFGPCLRLRLLKQEPDWSRCLKLYSLPYPFSSYIYYLLERLFPNQWRWEELGAIRKFGIKLRKWNNLERLKRKNNKSDRFIVLLKLTEVLSSFCYF